MIIKVSKNNEVQYLQVLEGSKPLNAVVGMLLTAPRGTEFAVEVSNDGPPLNFAVASIDLDHLVRLVNGIATKRVRPATTEQA